MKSIYSLSVFFAFVMMCLTSSYAQNHSRDGRRYLKRRVRKGDGGDSKSPHSIKCGSSKSKGKSSDSSNTSGSKAYSKSSKGSGCGDDGSPSMSPSISQFEQFESDTPTATPSSDAKAIPSIPTNPSVVPTMAPTNTTSDQPSAVPKNAKLKRDDGEAETPSATPTSTPSATPTSTPSVTPSAMSNTTNFRRGARGLSW